MVQELYDVLCHFGGGVTEERFVTLAHSSVVHDKRRVLVSFSMPEILELALPCLHETAQTHNPL